MRRSQYLTRLTLALAVSLAATLGAPTQAEDLRIVIGTAPGGSYDLTGRLVGRHIGKHLPGNPTVVPQNMPGAGSLITANDRSGAIAGEDLQVMVREVTQLDAALIGRLKDVLR